MKHFITQLSEIFIRQWKILVDKYTEIKNDFYRENFWAEHVVTQLDCWVAFYF